MDLNIIGIYALLSKLIKKLRQRFHCFLYVSIAEQEVEKLRYHEKVFNSVFYQAPATKPNRWKRMLASTKEYDDYLIELLTNIYNIQYKCKKCKKFSWRH